MCLWSLQQSFAMKVEGQADAVFSHSCNVKESEKNNPGSVTLSQPATIANGVYSEARPVLRPSLVESCWQMDTNEKLNSLAEVEF